MEMMPVKPERKAELEAYAQLRGESPAEALDHLLAAQLEWERQDYREAVEGINRGYDDLKAGRTRPVAVIPEPLTEKPPPFSSGAANPLKTRSS